MCVSVTHAPETALPVQLSRTVSPVRILSFGYGSNAAAVERREGVETEQRVRTYSW